MKYVNFCLSAVLLVLSGGSTKKELPSTGYQPGETIPNIVLTDLDGNRRNLHDYKGKKVVVNFWAAYDAQSRANNVRLYRYLEMNGKDVVFLSIAFDTNRQIVERTLALDDLKGAPRFYEMEGADSKIYKEFRLNRGFRSYFVDEGGVITAMNITPDLLKTIL